MSLFLLFNLRNLLYLIQSVALCLCAYNRRVGMYPAAANVNEARKALWDKTSGLRV